LPSPVTVGTSTTVNAIRYGPQRSNVHAQGLFWQFYSNGVNLVYKTSPDGRTWSTETIVRACTDGGLFCVFSNGVRADYIYSPGTVGGVLMYRGGALSVSGIITWAAAEADISVPAFVAADTHYPSFIIIDSDGYPVVTCVFYDASRGDYRYWAIRSTNKNGTWSPDGVFFTEFTGIEEFLYRMPIVPLTNRKIYLTISFAQLITTSTSGAVWDGSSWSVDYPPIIRISRGDAVSMVAYGDTVYYGYLTFPSYAIFLLKRDYGVGWGTNEAVSSATSISYPVLTIDKETGTVYCFWRQENKIYYKRRGANGIWDTVPFEWISDTLAHFQLASYYDRKGDNIGLAYVAGIASPYDIRFDHVDLVAEPPPAVVSTRLSAGGSRHTAKPATGTYRSYYNTRIIRHLSYLDVQIVKA